MTQTPSTDADTAAVSAQRGADTGAEGAPEPRAQVAALRARPSAKVLIIGGGINGCATFRDLAMQGVDVTLIERGDYVSGASSASSHMIHGGIRYLENGEFRLVHESVVERNRLMRTAPHYVKPLPTTVPIFSTFSGLFAAPLRFLTHRQRGHTERGALLIKTGLVIYDAFSRGGRVAPRHRFFGRKRSLAELPALSRDVRYTATYFDASMHDPERLALDVLHDGLGQGEHARAVNYIEAVGSSADGIRLRDNVTGIEFDFTADVVVNASGPWTDITNGTLGRGSRFMGGTKGSHIVLDSPELLAAVDGRELFFEHSDGRIVLIYPLKGRVMVGTTDLEHDMRDAIRCTEDEIDYFFDLVHHVLPDIALDRSQIVYRFAGVRPLPRHDDEAPGFVSRDYRIEHAPVPEQPGRTLLSLVGGKWTTFRALAEHLANEVLEVLGAPRRRSTARVAIGGGYLYPTTPTARAEWVRRNRGALPAERADQLLERYGTRAAAVIGSLGSDDEITALPGYSEQEIAWLVRNEQVVRLIDIVKRRTSVAFTGEITAAGLAALAAVAARELGWDEAKTALEIEHTAGVLAEAHGVVLDDALAAV